ncbi:MAG: DNA polymerase I [Candidatus Omnitrophota bacterium]
MDKKVLYLIDATAFCYRAFYALKGLATSFGQPTNAVYGFVVMLRKILKEKNPQYLAVCFDVSRDTFRKKKFAEYKIHRPPMPEGLTSQIPLIKQVIQAQGIASVEKQGFEADDIIATIAHRAKIENFSTVIVSSDKDILQLVNENTVVYSPSKDEDQTYTPQEVRERFGVAPERIPDIMALMGDDVDNIPGVRGIGEKTAVQLIKEFGSLKKLVDGADQIKQEKTRRVILDSLDRIRLNKELAMLDQNVDVAIDLESLKIKDPDQKELFRLFKYLEFKKFSDDIRPKEGISAEVPLSSIQDEALADLVKDEEELVLFGMSQENLVVKKDNKAFKIKNARSNLKSLLENPKVGKIGHDLKEMKLALAQEGIDLKGLKFDTMVAAYLLNPSKAQYSLADIAWDYLNELSAKLIDGAQAVVLIDRLKPHLEKELKEKDLLDLFEKLEMPLVEVLAAMQLTGIKLDVPVLEQLSRDIEKRLIKLIEAIYEKSGCSFNINSPKQLRQILFENLKLPVVKRSKTGPSTDEEVLKSLSDKHELPRLLLEYRQLTKLKNTYVDTLPALVNPRTGRLHTSFNQTATETGRLSSSNPNLQNLPVKTDIAKVIRKAVISSDEDSYLLSCDYSQIELRVLAHLSKDENLTLSFKENRDIHKATAALVYGLEEKDITGPMREVAKRVNFGIVYGLSSFGLSRDLNISLEEAQRFIDAYFLRYPGVQEYIQHQIQKAKEKGFVTTLLGRRRYIPQIHDKNQGIRQFAQRQAVNTPIQGTASDLIKLAMVQIHDQIRLRHFRSSMILQIHDELLFDVKSDEFEALEKLVKDRMENVLQLDVPIKVDIKKGKNWLDMEEIK